MRQITLISTLAMLVQVTNAQNWLITGNSGITTSNFLGTTDKANLIFRTNNIERGKLLKTGEWRLGKTANYAAIDVNGNLSFNGTAAYRVGGNKYVFQFSGNTNYGLFFNQTNLQYEFRNGSALSVFSVNANTGDAKVNGLTVGRGGNDSSNTVIGYTVFSSNTTGKNNTALGYSALFSNTSGNSNTASGRYALFSNTTGFNNTAHGMNSLSSNTIGFDNTASGLNALALNTEGNWNSAFGFAALNSNTSGFSNTASGFQALSSNTSGLNNTASGVYALTMNVDGDYNTAIGFSAGPNSQSLNNSSAFGNAATTTANNQVRIGNNQVTSIGGYTNWSNISDGRVKKNIKPNVPGLSFINKLKPVTYNYDLDAGDKLIQKTEVKDKGGKVTQLLDENPIAARKQKEQVVYTGFVAQQVEQAAKSIGYDFSGVDAAKNEHDLYSLRYAEFVVPLVKAVQELSQQNDLLKSKAVDLQNQIDELKAMILSNRSTIKSPAVISSASLQQNIPNPFDHTTTINYTLPQIYSSAKVVVNDKNGKVLKDFTLSAKGKNSVNVDASTFVSGAYSYSLFVDGKLIDTKQMVLQR